MFKQLRSKKVEMDMIEHTPEEPVKKEELQHLIDIIEVAKDIGASFDLVLSLTMGEFCVDSYSFVGIKMSNSKKDEGKLLIQHKQNMLLLNDTYIDIENIVHIDFKLRFTDKNIEDED